MKAYQITTKLLAGLSMVRVKNNRGWRGNLTQWKEAGRLELGIKTDLATKHFWEIWK